MKNNSSYYSPVGQIQIELKIKNSRFIGTAGLALSVASAKKSISIVRQRFSDASHHCFAFSVGFGSTEIQGRSDDGEPKGTAGQPMLAVLAGANLGNVFVVASRYFGGTKLGTGGLVRAYSETAKSALNALEIQVTYQTVIFHVTLPYEYFDLCKARLIEMGCKIENELYSSHVYFKVHSPAHKKDFIQCMVRDVTAGLAVIEEEKSKGLRDK